VDSLFLRLPFLFYTQQNEMNFLFWNTNKKANLHEIVELVKQEDTDLLMLAENTNSPAELLL